MTLHYKPKALQQLKKLPASEKKKVTRKLEFLTQNPLIGKPLKGEFKGLLALRAWPYRIIYQVTSAKTIVFSISHRQGTYQ